MSERKWKQFRAMVRASRGTIERDPSKRRRNYHRAVAGPEERRPDRFYYKTNRSLSRKAIFEHLPDATAPENNAPPEVKKLKPPTARPSGSFLMQAMALMQRGDR
jgi:hypothetical protein